MLARFVLGAVTAGAVIAPALAGQMINADEARRFVAGKMFAFTCFDGTRGAGRIFEDGGAAGAVQFSGSGPVRHLRLPGNTLQVRGQSVCASIRGFVRAVLQPRQADERNFRGSVSGMGFAYCDFRRQAPPRCCWRERWRGRVRCVRRSGPARWKYPRCASRPRNSRDKGSSRSNPRRDPSFRNRKALRSCAVRPTDRCLSFAGLNQP